MKDTTFVSNQKWQEEKIGKIEFLTRKRKGKEVINVRKYVYCRKEKRMIVTYSIHSTEKKKKDERVYLSKQNTVWTRLD